MQDKKTLITIIVLLAIFLPASILGIYQNNKLQEEGPVIVDDNPNHDFIYNNKLYFYYNNELLATYDCVDCSRSTSIIDDTAYHTNYFADGTLELPTVLNVNVGLYRQNNLDYVYSITIGRSLSYFYALKNYNVEHTEQVLIAKNENRWGVVSVINDALVPIISYNYEYIALPSHLIDGKLDTSKYIAMNNNYWYILKNDGTSDYAAFAEEVVDFNDLYYITYNNGYHIYDYDNNEYLSGITKRRVYATSEYILVINSDNSLSVYTDCNSAAINRITLPTYTSLYFNQTSSGVDIMLDGNLYQTIV